MSPLQREESFALWIGGKVIICMGVCLSLLSVFVDVIMRGWDFSISPLRMGWFQIAGVIAGIIIAVYGVWMDRFLNKTLKEIIYEWANK